MQGKAINIYKISISSRHDYEEVNWTDPAGGTIRDFWISLPVNSEKETFVLQDLPPLEYSAWIIPGERHYEWPRQKVVLEKGQTKQIRVEVPSKAMLYGRVLFEDGRPAVIDPAPWSKATSQIILCTEGIPMSWEAGNLDRNGYFSITPDKTDLENLRSGKSHLSIGLPNPVKEHHHLTGGNFPFEFLNPSKAEAGVISIPIPDELESYLQQKDKLVLHLLDPEGQPVPRTKIGSFARRRTDIDGIRELEWNLSRHKTPVASDDQGQIYLTPSKLFYDHWPAHRKTGLYFLQEDRKLSGLHEVSRGDSGFVAVKLAPTCRVHGTLTNRNLDRIGRPLSWSSVGLYWNYHRLLSDVDEANAFEFLLPPGEYRFHAHGRGSRVSTKRIKQSFEVKPNPKELDVGQHDLPLSKIAFLVDGPALEIGPIKAWKNGPKVRLADLKGNIVLLHFGGEYPSTRYSLLELSDLYDVYHRHGLEIIAIYNYDSLEELETNFDPWMERFGGIRQVAFRMAVDGGKPTHIAGTGKARAGATYGTYDITSYPTTVLIDQHGAVLGEYYPQFPDRTIEKFLNLPRNVGDKVPSW